MLSCLRSCPPGDVVFTEDGSYNPNCHLARHAIFSYGHLPGVELQDGGWGGGGVGWGTGEHRISETTPPFPGLSVSLALVGKEKRRENAEGHNVRAIKLTLGAKTQGGTRRWHLHQMTVFVYRFAWKLFRPLARSIENEARLRQTHPHP